VVAGAAALAVTAAGCSPGKANLHLSAAAADPNANCSLIVPANPLTAAGLATPYQLTATDPAAGPCNEANAAQSAFVQGAILTRDGQLTLYDPLVIDAGTQPAAPPAAAQVPAGATVALWFGFNGDNLTLQAAGAAPANNGQANGGQAGNRRRNRGQAGGAQAAGGAAAGNSLAQGNCVNGLNGSIFGQFASCNGAAFFQAANTAIAANKLQVPALAMAKDNMPCPTVRDFSVVDQDQSDNVTAQYLATANGQIAQKNAAAMAVVGNNTTNLANASDNLLLDQFILPTLGCAPWTRPNGAQDGQPTGSLPLNELQAAAGQRAPIALVPLNDPMTLVNNNQSTQKTNLYRAAVGQAQLGAAGGDNGDGAAYCTNLYNSPNGIRRVFNDQAIFANGPTPDAGAGTNLFTFLATRANDAFTNLNCANFGLTNPITLTMDGNGVTTAATIAPVGQAGGTATTPPAGGTATTPAAGTTTAPAGTMTTAPAGTTPPKQTRTRNGRRQVSMHGRFPNW